MVEPLIADEPCVLARADATAPSLPGQLRAVADRGQFKDFMGAGLACCVARAQPTQQWCWLADPRHVSASAQQVQQWLADDRNVGARRAGLRAVSTVAPPDKHVLEPVNYEPLAAAKQRVAKRGAVLNA